MNNRASRIPIVVDLFCGAGGLSHGFVRQRIKVVAGIDCDPSCKYPFESNNAATFVEKSIEEVTGEELAAFYPPDCVKVLVGCAPCQPFSTYNTKRSNDGKWSLLYEYSRLIEESRPDVVSMENVPRITKHPVFTDFVRHLEEHDYQVTFSTVSCLDYGVPQTRNRLVLLASRFGKIEMIPPTRSPDRYEKVQDAIGHLPALRAGEQSASDPLHLASKLSPQNEERIKRTPEGGGWKNWDNSLVLECHKKESGKYYGSVYGRMKWKAPAPTITTQCTGYGNGRFGHPEQDRAISLREAALLQSFPGNYQFFAPESPLILSHIARLIGNAVPVRLGEAIAQSVKRHLESFCG